MSSKKIVALPLSWEFAQVAEVATLFRGVTYQKSEAMKNASNGYLPVLRATNITGVGLTFEQLVYVPQSCVSLDQMLATGDVVVASSSGSKDVVGKAGQLLGEKFVGSFGAFCTAIRPASSLKPAFLGYYFQSPNYRRAISDMAAGSNINNIKSSDLSGHLVPVAPCCEQVRIVAKLDELLSDLDAGIAELKAGQRKLALYRQSLLKAAVEGALTADWRARNPPTETGAQLLERILEQRRARWETRQLARFKEQGKVPPKDWYDNYPEPVRPDVDGLPALPQGWAWASGEQICEFITKGTTPPKGMNAGEDKTIPFLRVTNLSDIGELDLTDRVFVSDRTHRDFLARSVVLPNDVLMNIVGPPLGQVVVVPRTYGEWNVNQAIAIFRAVDGVAPGFVCRYLMSPSAQQWLLTRSKTTAGQTNLTLEVCRSLPFPLPPEGEQLQLVVELNGVLDAVQSQLHAIDIAFKQCAAQRKGILRAAFAGQLVPQDPTDEPASELLARIRAERAAQAGKTTSTRGRRKAVQPV